MVNHGFQLEMEEVGMKLTGVNSSLKYVPPGGSESLQCSLLNPPCATYVPTLKLSGGWGKTDRRKGAFEQGYISALEVFLKYCFSFILLFLC